jgi:hypothetical protein
MLRPPRQLFVGDIDVPVRPAGHGGLPQRRPAATTRPKPPGPASSEERNTPDGTAPGLGIDLGEENATRPDPGSAPIAALVPPPGAPALLVSSAAPATAPMPDTGAEQSPAASAWQHPAAGIPVTPDGGDTHEPPRRAPQPVGAAPSLLATDEAANSPSAGRFAPREWPAAPSTSPSRADAGQVPMAGAAARQAMPLSPAARTTAPPGPGTAEAAGSRQDQRTDDVSDAVPAVEVAADPGRRWEPAPVLDLRPAPSSRSAPARGLRAEPGEVRAPRLARVSIGTIEVTVVPPAPPAPAVPEIRPQVPVSPRWPRPSSLLATSAGSDRLRDGLRRWYGTAQG